MWGVYRGERGCAGGEGVFVDGRWGCLMYVRGRRVEKRKMKNEKGCIVYDSISVGTCQDQVVPYVQQCKLYQAHL